MPIARSIVANYTVSVRPFTLRNDGTFDTQKRVIWLYATPQTQTRVSNVFLEFHEGAVPTEPGSFVSENEFVGLKIALVHFAELYSVLQTEAPIEVDMIIRDDGTVSRFRLGTSTPEPPGEGVAGDHSV